MQHRSFLRRVAQLNSAAAAECPRHGQTEGRDTEQHSKGLRNGGCGGRNGGRDIVNPAAIQAEEEDQP